MSIDAYQFVSSGCSSMPSSLFGDANSRQFEEDFTMSYIKKQLSEIKNHTMQTQTKKVPFEIKVTIPISHSMVYANSDDRYTSADRIGIVTVEQAVEIRDAINRQLAGLKATEPKPRKTKKLAKKTAKKK